MNITPFQQNCVTYLTNLRAMHQHALATVELSLRADLEAFLKQAAELANRPVRMIGEAKKLAVGKPDLTVAVHDLPIGYIEAEAYNVNLDKLTGHAKEQNDRFRANLDNFLLTNHLEFRLYIGGELVDRAALPEPPESGKIAVTSVEAEQLATLLDRFLQGQFPAIRSPKDLARHLARRTRQIHAEILRVLTDPDLPSGEIGAQYAALQDVLIPDLSVAQFADLYAQTITYGLFAARCVPSSIPFSRLAAATLIPATNPFLRKLFQHIAAFELDPRIAWIADDTVQLLAHAPMADILTEFSARTGKDDPIVHFYETFLAEYDPKVREMRGVYYTPEPVVAYIVRSLDYLLKTRFNKPLGLADKDTLILDPATGTGSFLFAIVRQIYDTICQTYGEGAWHDYVQDKLLPRLFGFELLIAPYAVAHLKLGLLLQELHYTFTDQQRLGVYLTNTLEEALKKSEVLFGKFIADEANEAAAIKKDRSILVVLGNPPYSGHSANRSRDLAGDLTFIGRLIEDYRRVDGKPLGERNPKWLQDDYVKFIRFAEWRITRTGEGLVGFVTNHGYLDNPTFRGMRQHILQAFDEIYVLDLHGSSRKHERTPEDGKDDNVFDIQQGVAICLLVRYVTPRVSKRSVRHAKVYHADLYGIRSAKYAWLGEHDVSQTTWTELAPHSPLYLFTPHDVALQEEYDLGWKITEIMPVNSVGIVTGQDAQAVSFTNADSQAIAKAARIPLKAIQPMLYRPFDWRFLIYHKKMVTRPREEVMRHIHLGENIGLCANRQVNATFHHIFCANTFIGDCTVSSQSRERTYFFPLYLYPNGDVPPLLFEHENGRRPNLAAQFIEACACALGLNFIADGVGDLQKTFGPEDIFHYAYALFHSPTYRARYAEFLKMDFPRLPLTSDLDLFRDLAALGQQLVALHLLDAQAAPILHTPRSPFPVGGDNLVEKVRYDDATQRVLINPRQYFDAVPPDVWAFQVGGYQVCDKWLKDRKGWTLTFDDIQHYQQIVIALSETIRLMAAIDERIPGFPIQ